MAHMKKYAKGSVQSLALHIERKTKNHSNKDIDVSRSYLNYSLIKNDDRTMMKRLNDRLQNVYCMKRDDVKVCCSWVVTLPKEYLENSSEEQRQFFEKTYEFLNKNYGQKNVIAAEVHNDETTPHVHYSFIPVVKDKKRGEKVSAKEFFNREHFQKFHDRLDDYLKKNLQFYVGGIKNDSTKVNIDDVEDFKKVKREIKKIEQEKLQKVSEKNALENQKNDLENKINKLKNEDVELENKINLKQKNLENIKKAEQKNFEVYQKSKKAIEQNRETLNTLILQIQRKRKEFEDEKQQKENEITKIVEDAKVRENKEFANFKQSLIAEKHNLLNENESLRTENNELKVKKQRLEKEVDKAQNLKESKQAELDKLNYLKNDVKEIASADLNVSNVIRDIESRVQYAKTLKREEIVKMPVSDYEKLLEGFKSVITLKADVVRMKDDVSDAYLIKQRENERESSYRSMQSTIADVSLKNSKLSNEIMNKDREISKLKNYQEQAQSFIQVVNLSRQFHDYRFPMHEQSNEREY